MFIAKGNIADFWCPENVLESLVRCIFQCEEGNRDAIEEINCRIQCAKEAYCIPKLWDLFNRRMEHARQYSKCMIRCADYFKNVVQHKLDLILCDFGCRKDFDMKLAWAFDSEATENEED